jgi:RNA polymerase sigma-70 factor (ECF subfamily)
MTGTLVSHLADLVTRARTGDLDAFGRLVEATQAMAYGVARSVLRDPTLAQDAVQEAYLAAYRRLGDLGEPAAFAAWLRRIVVTVSLNLRRGRRRLLCLDDVPDVPVLDEAETTWSDEQRQRLGRALVLLSVDERRLCDRRYHGRWSIARLASHAGVEEGAMRKRLQRIRDKLRREMEMAEQRAIPTGELPDDLPARVADLLARPRLTDLPENPVGRVLDDLRAVYADFDEIELPEVIDFATAVETVGQAVYVDHAELHRVDDRRILRYDLTLPLLLTARFEGRPLRLWAAGKAYRVCQTDALHLEAFHQAEVFYMDDRSRLDPWQMTARVLQAVYRVLPGRTVKIVPTEYAMCRQAWELEVEADGRWYEVVAWGVYSDALVGHLGGDPNRHTAMGVGCGLERLAMLRFGVDDIRKIEASRVA